jgi:hypothetical protein
MLLEARGEASVWTSPSDVRSMMESEKMESKKMESEKMESEKMESEK